MGRDPETPEERQVHHNYELKKERVFRKVSGNLKWVVPVGLKWREKPR